MLIEEQVMFQLRVDSICIVVLVVVGEFEIGAEVTGDTMDGD